MNGVLYGVGVGPGDPELLTLKAVRLLQQCDVVAVPDSASGELAALEIAREHIGQTPVLHCPLPMTRDPQELMHSWRQSADRLCQELQAGKTVVFLTLGDPSVYSTYLYLHRLVTARGYRAEMVPGVPSFCAAAAALGQPLCEGGEPLHILPASYAGVEEALALDGTKVLMKSGRSMPKLLATLRQKGMLAQAALVERCGMPGQRLVADLAQAQPDTPPGYFSTVIVKEREL